MEVQMLFNILNFITSNLSFFTGSYSNNIFPDPLTKEEEDMYIEKMLNGDKEARNKLIEHNLRLVAHIVKKFETTNNDVDDLIGIGTVGLIKGIDTYSKNRNVKLTTYAAKCSENEILMHLRKTSKQKNEISLEEPLNTDSDGNELVLADILSLESDSVSKNIEQSTERELLYKCLSKLSDREKEIITLRFGLVSDSEEKTQKEVADMLGISQSYISRIEKKIISRLNKELKKSF